MTQNDPPKIRVRVNGDERELSAATRVADLLEELGVDPRHTAVERNREIVPKTAFAATVLADGDVVEIVTLVGGG